MTTLKPIEPKIEYRSEGRVADFCPFCRAVRAHLLLTKVQTINLVDSGEEVGWVIECETCGALLPSHPRIYARTDGDVRESLDELVRSSSVEMHPALTDRLMREVELQAGELDEEDRWRLLLEPLQLSHEGRESTRALLHRFLTVVVGLLVAIALACIPSSVTVTSLSFFGGFTVSAAAWWFLFARKADRADRERWLRRLVHALRPLRPRREELLAAGRLLAKHGNPLGPLVASAEGADLLLRAMEEMQPLPAGTLDPLLSRIPHDDGAWPLGPPQGG